MLKKNNIAGRRTAISYAAKLDGHVLGTLCAVTMALLTNRLDLCIQDLFGAGKSKSMTILILALLELDTNNKLKILFLCKENSGTPFPPKQRSKCRWGWIRATTFEGTLQGGLEGSLPAEGGEHEGEKGLKPP